MSRARYPSMTASCAAWMSLFLLVGASSAAENSGVFRLRSWETGTWKLDGQVVTAKVSSVSMRGPVLRTRSGILNLTWENLVIEDAGKIGHESGYFRIHDSRHSVLGPRKIELSIFLVSKRDRAGETNRVVLTRTVEHMNYSNEHWRGKDPKSSSWRNFSAGNPARVPEFLDDATVLIPREKMLMFRLTDQGGRLEPFQVHMRRHRALGDGEPDHLRYTFSLPQSKAVTLDYDIATLHPELPEWSLQPPDGWAVTWYGRTMRFSRDRTWPYVREAKWLLASEDDGPDATFAEGQVTLIKR